MKQLKILLITSLLFTGCFKDNEEIDYKVTPTEETAENEDVFDPSKKAVIGDRIINPYSVANMKKAFNSLSKKTRGYLSADDIITVTHKHLKFTFKDDENFNVINNKGIELFYLPMDIEILESGYYEDAGYEDGTRIRYACVPIELMDFIDACKVHYDVLDDLFLPDEDDYESKGYTTRSGALLNPLQIEELVNKSFILTGNEDWLCDNSSIRTRASKKTPFGTIRIQDSFPGNPNRYIGLAGLKVRATRIFKVGVGITGADGYYRCDKSFSNNWNYETDFQRADFDINSGKSGRFCWVKNKTTSEFSFNISKNSGKGFYMATIFRAVHHYYYEGINGLRRPPMNGTFKTQMKIAAMYEKSDEYDGYFSPSKRFLGMGNPIHIYNPQNLPQDIYSTVIHELCHSSHWQMSKSDYNQENAEMYRLRNTWARGVQYSLVRMKYPHYSGGGTWFPNYTNLVVDLLDTESDHFSNVGYNIAEGDNVQGYTIRQIEDCMIGTRTWIQFRDKIYNSYPNNSSRNNLATLFNAWYR